jgi:hypothetical protein
MYGCVTCIHIYICTCIYMHVYKIHIYSIYTHTCAYTDTQTIMRKQLGAPLTLLSPFTHLPQWPLRVLQIQPTYCNSVRLSNMHLTVIMAILLSRAFIYCTKLYIYLIFASSNSKEKYFHETLNSERLLP